MCTFKIKYIEKNIRSTNLLYFKHYLSIILISEVCLVTFTCLKKLQHFSLCNFLFLSNVILKIILKYF